MNHQWLQGKLVRLSAEDPQVFAEASSRWSRDSEYWRLLATDAAYPQSVKMIKDWIEKDLEKDLPDFYRLAIRLLEDDRLIGEIGLENPSWTHGDSFVSIGLGERDCWGKGYGTEAMRLILDYAFSELNLFRVSLTVFEYNPRAIRSYEKAGFREEGRMRSLLFRDGKRYDLIFMGILRSEWETLIGQEKVEQPD